MISFSLWTQRVHPDNFGHHWLKLRFQRVFEFFFPVFAAGNSFPTLFLARASQGIASACIGVTGMSLVADTHSSEPERSKAMGFVLGSAACGVLIGYPFGGFMYQLFGKTPPFVILAFVVFTLVGRYYHQRNSSPIKNYNFSFSDSILLLGAGSSGKRKKVPENRKISNFLLFFCFKTDVEQANWLRLLKDKRVLICGGTIGVSTSAMAILEPCLPIWLLGHIHPKVLYFQFPPCFFNDFLQKWQLGTAFIPDSLGYVFGTNTFSLIAYREGRPRVAMAAMLLVSLSCIAVLFHSFLLGFLVNLLSQIPLASTMMQLVVPHFLLGLGIGAVDAALVPLLAELADNTHTSSYGTVYAVQQMSVSIAYALGEKCVLVSRDEINAGGLHVKSLSGNKSKCQTVSSIFIQIFRSDFFLTFCDVFDFIPGSFRLSRIFFLIFFHCQDFPSTFI